ncbi:MAG: type IV pilus assembly protein PilO [Kiritimatiellia bacterium]|jgi:type IV pilus assembly protein PilO
MSLQDTFEQINNFDINDIDWSRVGVWPLIGRMCVWLVAIVAVFVLVYFFFVKDLQGLLAGKVSEEQTLRSSFQGKAFQAATLDQQRKLMVQIEKDFEFLVAQLPKKTQVPGLLDDIDEKGRGSGLEIVSIKLLPEERGAFYITLPIEVIVVGSYHSMGSFVSGIAGMSRIVTLHDVNIRVGNDPSSLKMLIKAKTYRALDEGGA